MKSWLMIVLDSCRVESFELAMFGPRMFGPRRQSDRPRWPADWLLPAEHVGYPYELWDGMPDLDFRRISPALVRDVTYEARISAATWTGPAHYHLLSGLPPMRTEHKGLDTPGMYLDELRHTVELLGLPVEAGAKFHPELWLPSWLRGLGYRTTATVSLPVLSYSPCQKGFNSWLPIRPHDDARFHVDHFLKLRQNQREGGDTRPIFHLMNLGDTHYPYTVGGRHPFAEHPPDRIIRARSTVAPLSTFREQWEADVAAIGSDPHLHGLNGVARRLLDGVGTRLAAEFTSPERMGLFRRRQVAACARALRAVIPAIEAMPSGSRITITADHGEAFGEDGWFGHGAVRHPIVLDVPYYDAIRL